MSIALFLLTLFFPPRPFASQAVAAPATVAPMSPRLIIVDKPVPAIQRYPAHLPVYTVTATVYNAEPKQTDSEPFVTADNSHISPNQTSKSRWMALSRDMLKSWGGNFKYGDSIEVSGISPALDGTYIVHDTMARRHHHCIDLLVNRREALYAEWVRFGKWAKVKIRKAQPALPEWAAS